MIILVIAPLTPNKLIKIQQLKPAKYVLYAIKTIPMGTKKTFKEHIDKIIKKQA